ncbi:hypothetical protein MBLNU230_g3903t1 [Neophaeotheca triangularis]
MPAGQFRRVVVPNTTPANPLINNNSTTHDPTNTAASIQAYRHQQSLAPHPNQENMLNCLACRTYHAVGYCPLKVAGVERCNLCGLAHYGHARVCPHLQSETQVRAMLSALKQSQEPAHLVNEARKYLKGLKGNLVQLKKQKAAKEHAIKEAEAANANVNQQAHMGLYGGSAGAGGGYSSAMGYGGYGGGYNGGSYNGSGGVPPGFFDKFRA